jgi:hypothetical protein
MKNFFKFFQDFSRIFQEFFWNIFQKAITNVVKKQASVLCVILFTLVNQRLLSKIILFEIAYF